MNLTALNLTYANWCQIVYKRLRIFDEKTKSKVLQLLNYYGWKAIKDNGWSVCAERIYGDKWNNFYDTEAEKDDDCPF